MPARDLPARPNLEQYKTPAKELLDACNSWPKFAKHIETLTIAREVDSLADPREYFGKYWPLEKTRP